MKDFTDKLSIGKATMEKYEEIRSSGKYNMFTDNLNVILELGCTVKEYAYILENYSELMELYSIERK